MMGWAFAHLGAKSKDIVVPPAKGFDNGVIRLSGGGMLVFTADPISYIPSLGVGASAWLSVHHLASDLATAGVAARYAVVDYNLPGDIDDKTLSSYLSSFGRECRKLGISIVGGHTGRYPGCGLTIVGAAFLFSETGESGYVTPAMAEEGDRVLVTKGPAIEATAVLAHSFPSKVREALGGSVLANAKHRIFQCSTVADASAAASVGLREGVTSMHDATEGGIVTALEELAFASGKEIAVDLRLIPVPEDVGKVCSLFGLNPFETLSEGTLLITCRPEKSALVKSRLKRNGIECFEVGEVRRGALRALGEKRDLRLSEASLPPEIYWDVYERGIEEGWS
jgi:hydrogenase maturation factor